MALQYNVRDIVLAVETNFLPDKFRIMAKLSGKASLACSSHGTYRLWIRSDGCRYREMHVIKPRNEDLSLADRDELISQFWHALINEMDGEIFLFGGPFSQDPWRQAYKVRSSVFVKNIHSVNYGSDGILKNPVWRVRKY